MHQIMADVSLHFLGPFSFKTSEHSFHRSVVPAVSTTTHALAHAVTPEPLAKLSVAMLNPDPSETVVPEACLAARKPCPELY